MTKPAYRFAPSPNGPLHLGHAYSALYTDRAARQAGGRFLLRIEDIDFTRCRPHFSDWIFEDLAWLGLSWQAPVLRQSENRPAYRAALDRLKGLGLLYPCFCTRKRLKTLATDRDPDGASLYDGQCRAMDEDERERRLTAGEAHALRLDMAKAMKQAGGDLSFDERGEGPAGEHGRLALAAEAWGDVVLARKDIAVSYHIAVTVDDAAQEISCITRGQDLFYATAIHRLLQSLLDLPVPAYQHHRLIGDETGRKLSKSAGDKSLRALRDEGVSAREIRQALGFPDA